MYVYELAIALGKRSTDLSDAADQLGIGPLIAASELSPDQHARLVHHFTGQVVAPPAGAPMGAPMGGPPGTAGPMPMPSPQGGGRHVPWPMVVLGAVLAIGALVAGSYVLVGGQQDEFERQVDAQAAAEARGEIPESEPTDDGADGPAPAPEGAPTTTAPGAPVTTAALDLSDDRAVERARCAASQKVADLDDEGDVLNTDAPSWEQFTWAIDQAEAMLPELKAAYDELRAVVPPEVQGDIDAVWQITEDMTRQLSAVTSPDQLRGVVDAISAREAELAGPLMRLDAYVQDECDITLAD